MKNLIFLFQSRFYVKFIPSAQPMYGICILFEKTEKRVMKTIQFKLIAFLVLLSGIGAACSVSDDNNNYCFISKNTAATGVSGPSETTVNTPITLEVKYTPLGSCGKFNKFTETTNFPKDIKILVDYEGCDCGFKDITATQPYTFTASTPGTYVLNFLTASTIPVSKTITVTAE